MPAAADPTGPPVDALSRTRKRKAPAAKKVAHDEPIEEGSIDVGELVAQWLYQHLAEREMAWLQESSEEFAPGTVVYDSDADEP